LLFLIFQANYILTQSLKFLDSTSIAIETILVFIYISFYFYEFLKKETGEYIYDHYCFWLSIGILIYLGGSLFFFILINHLSKEQRTTFGYLTYTTEIIKNILFIVALFVYQKNQIHSVKKKSVQIPKLDII